MDLKTMPAIDVLYAYYKRLKKIEKMFESNQVDLEQLRKIVMKEK